MTQSSLRTVEVGTELEPVSMLADLAALVRYAGASGDLNPLHYNPEFAAGVSPTGGIIAHGMLSMGLVSRALTAFAGGPEQVVSVEVRFTRPWPLNTTSTFGGKVTAVDGELATVALFGDNEGGIRILRGTGMIRVV